MASRARGRKTPPPPAKTKKKPKLEGLSQEQLAERVGCAQSTVSRAAARGDIRPLSNGRFAESAVEILRSLRSTEEEDREEIRELNRRLLAAQAGEREA